MYSASTDVRVEFIHRLKIAQLQFWRPRPQAEVNTGRSANDVLDFVIAACVSGMVLYSAILISEALLHWLLLPVFACGVLSGADAVAWARRKLDLFDPLGLVGAYGYYSFFLAPILTVAWQFHSRALAEPPEWNNWIGWMATINLAGLLFYRAARRLFWSEKSQRTWRIHSGQFVRLLAIAIPVTTAVQIYIFVQFGGMWGFMETFSEAKEAFVGMGWQFLIGESLPFLAALFVLVRYRSALHRAPWSTLLALIVLFFVLKMVCGGLRGSRSHTVWGLFWLVGAIHFWIRPVPRKIVIAGLAFLMVFMFGYGLYKAQGIEVFQTLQNGSLDEDEFAKSGRTLDSTLLADLSRTEIQAYLLYRVAGVQEYDVVHGSTYLAAFNIFLPKSIRPDSLPDKVVAGTSALYGRNSFRPYVLSASQVYGLAGEALLNFPPWCAPLAFITLGYGVAKCRALLSLDRDDLRRLLLPFLVNATVLMITSDLDNMVMFLVRTSTATVVVLLLSMRSAPALWFPVQARTLKPVSLGTLRPEKAR